MLLGVYAYFIEHKQRNTLIWLPTDGDAENFMKTHVEPTIRDIPSLLALAPWYGKKHRDNTLTMKRFTNGRGFWCLGGKAAKNYREKSVDVAGYDELAAFDDDIEQEGSPTFLGDKRIEGSVWPKSIRGSTPKVRGTCQIERAASESPHFMRFHVACPHCGEEQYLKFGDKETPFGLKWTPDDPSSVFYLCEHNACVIRQQELDFTDARYICEKTGIWTRDGILWFSSSGEEIEPPDSVTFHIWTAYSPFTTWVQIVKDWMKTKGDTGKRKTFVNTTLGETWEAKIGERPDAEVMAERKEHYSAPVPDRVAYLTAGIDSQLDRYEMRVWGWGPGEESWLIDRQIIMGRHDDEQTLLRVDEAINKTYTRRNGAEMSISRICWDTGGIDPTIVYERSKKHGLFRVIPIKGASVCLAVSGAPAWASEHQSTLSAGYLHARTNVPGSDDLNGINVKYRYEFTDTLGLVTSFSYAGDKNRQLTRYSDTRWHEDSVRNRWFSVMAGPSVRVNEWFSAYAMAGMAYSSVSTFSGDYLRVTDNKGKTHDVLTGSDDGRHSNTSLAWGAGVQFNPTESVAIDIAYEGSGSGDWRTDGFIVGVGYKF